MQGGLAPNKDHRKGKKVEKKVSGIQTTRMGRRKKKSDRRGKVKQGLKCRDLKEIK